MRMDRFGRGNDLKLPRGEWGVGNSRHSISSPTRLSFVGCAAAPLTPPPRFGTELRQKITSDRRDTPPPLRNPYQRHFRFPKKIKLANGGGIIRRGRPS